MIFSGDNAGTMAKRIILHLDMDSFYASVEMHEHPDLRGKPVVIGADPRQGTGRGVVCTCSYEARASGIHSAMPVSQAYSLCPDAIFLPPRFPLYIHTSEQVMAIVKSTGFSFQQVSIDEAFLDVSPLSGYAAVSLLAQQIKTEIEKILGITCSVGIAPTKIVAKIATDYQKPNGLTVVEPDHVISFLAPLAVRKIPGIGAKTENLLHEVGIKTIGELAGFDVQVLIAKFGNSGVAMHDAALGIDDSEVIERDGSRSVSRMTTFAEDTDDTVMLAETMGSLADELYRTLKKEGFRFKTLTVTMRYKGFITKTKAKTFPHFTDDEAAIHLGAQALLRELFDGRKIRLLGLRLSTLEKHDTRQTTLF